MAEAQANTEEKAPKKAPPAPKAAADSGTKWSEARCQKFARRFDSEADWKVGHPSSFKAASHWGWLDGCCGHMKNRGSAPVSLNAKRQEKAAKAATKKKKTATKRTKTTKTAKTTKRKSA